VAIANLDQLINGMNKSPRVFAKDTASNEAAGISHTPWYATGITGAGAAPGGGLNGANFTGPSLAGQIPMPAAVSGQLVYLAKLSLVHTGGIGHVWLVDKQWGNVPVVTTTTSQAITQPTLPARDNSGSTNGDGVLLALECSSTTGNAGAITNTTVSYTNSANTSGRTATLASYPATAVAGTWVPFSLQAGDVGVRSVQSITLGTSYVSGAIHLVAFRFIGEVAAPTANVGAEKSFTGLNLPYIPDTSVLQLVYWPTGTTVGTVSGSLAYAQG
jgi:hypothetical protein